MGLLSVDEKEFITTITGEDQPDNLEQAITGFVSSEYSRFRSQREELEDTWLEAWSLYLGTPQAVSHQRNEVLQTVGLVNNDWRHRINVGKAYEVVETIHGYLMAATFPNNEWFSVNPVSPGYLELSRVVKKYVANKLFDCNFRSHFENFLRQLLITGTSVMALPWRYETRAWKKNIKVKRPVLTEFGEYEEKLVLSTVEEERIVHNSPEFQTLDVFDCYIDPVATDPNTASFIRRIVKSKAAVIHDIKKGYYKDIEALDVVNFTAYNTCGEEKDQLRTFQGIETDSPYNLGDTVEILEYWGDVHLDGITYHDVCVTTLGHHLLRFETNPFWCGKPFIVGSCTALTQTPYAVGVIQPNMGLLHQLNIITNQRLDNLELAIDEMFTLRSDGVLQAEDVFTAPGKVFLVSDPADLQPIARNTQHYTVTYQEGAVLEQTIDKNSGTGALISANAARSGERVTAAEIQAVRDAGGNRLSNLHKHIEDTTLLPLLAKVYRLLQQFVTEDEITRVSGAEPGSFDYFAVGTDQLSYDFVLRPIGADHVTDRSRYIKDRLEFLQAVAQIPQMAEKLNYEQLLFDLVQHFGFDDPDSYIVEAKAVPQATPQPQNSAMPPSPEQRGEPTLSEEMYRMGGSALQTAVQSQLSMDGGSELLAKTYGQDIPPEVLAQLAAQQQVPQQ